MNDAPTGSPAEAESVEPELVLPTTDGELDGEEHNNVAEPAKVMRVGTMIRQLLEGR